MYGGALDNPRRGRLDNVFSDNEYAESSVTSTSSISSPVTNGGGLVRSFSQPDFMQELSNSEPLHQEPASIFIRPGIGSLTFR